jgi:hypothetical protein
MRPRRSPGDSLGVGVGIGEGRGQVWVGAVGDRPDAAQGSRLSAGGCSCGCGCQRSPRVGTGCADAFDQLAACGERRRSVGRRYRRRVRMQALCGFKSHRYRSLPGQTPVTSCWRCPVLRRPVSFDVPDTSTEILNRYGNGRLSCESLCGGNGAAGRVDRAPALDRDHGDGDGASVDQCPQVFGIAGQQLISRYRSQRHQGVDRVAGRGGR